MIIVILEKKNFTVYYDEINNYICESGLDVESACLNLNMQQEEINLINLIYPRYFSLL